MKCLDCRYIEINEHGFKGFLGETILSCKICNKIASEMEDCEEFKENNMRRIDTCWFCGKENVDCDITVISNGKMAVCAKCVKELKEDAEYVDPRDLI